MEVAGGVGLVLEGGGMRGVFTAGILDYFMEQNLYFPYLIGVSAGACHAVSYISRQVGRNKAVNIGYITDPRYISYGNFLKHKSLLGMDFIFEEIPKRLVPFDYQTFNEATEKLVVGTTECVTGAPVYLEKGQCDILQAIRASSSLPFIAQPVQINGMELLDGGMSDPIPLRKAMADGYRKNVVVLTKPEGYRLKPFKAKWLAKLIYPRFPGLVEAMVRRYEVYNQSLELVEQLHKAGQVFVIRPVSALQVKRMERDPQKLNNLYEEGYNEGDRVFSELRAWLSKA